jgi:hypothetical protein
VITNFFEIFVVNDHFLAKHYLLSSYTIDSLTICSHFVPPVVTHFYQLIVVIMQSSTHSPIECFAKAIQFISLAAVIDEELQCWCPL